MRLVLVTQMWPTATAPQLGAFVERQARALETLGVDVVVAAAVDGRRGIAGVGRHLRLAEAARRVSPGADAVLAHYLFPAGAAARRAARRAGAALIVTAHGTDVANAESSRVLRWLTQRVLDDADAVICVSDNLKQRLTAICNITAPVHVIDMGVSTDVFHPGDRDLAAAALGEMPQRPLIVQVGRKNVDRLVEAVAIVRTKHPTATLWVAGGQPSTDASRHVRFLGSVAPSRVGRLLRAGDCACLVSEREGYGLAALEAVACGVPTVVSVTAPVARDLPATCAVTADPLSPAAIADAIERALRLSRDDAAGLAVAQRHAVAAQAERVLAVIDATVAARRR
jgi:glycosyltransferase involved in cell wall biosynthesis